MARKSLRPYLNQIRAWTRQGRTDAWVAHQLEVSVQEVEQFKRQNELAGAEESAAGVTGADAEEIDLRAADEALIAAELEAEQTESERAEQEQAEAAAEDEEQEPRARRRARGEATSRRAAARKSRPMEGTFDHGEEGYGLWLDPAVRDNPIYAEHWAGHRPIEVTIEEDQIVIRRLLEDSAREESLEEDSQQQ
jgi:hypothetical protein